MEEDKRLVLNLGCGSDRFGDIRLDFVATAATNIVADAQELPFKNEIFNEIYERNLLEHMPNPSRHLSEVHRVLREGGSLSLVTDNAACLKYYVLGTHTGGYCRHEGKDRHYALFTKEHIKNHLLRLGFSIVKLEYVDSDYFTRFFDRLTRVFLPSLSYPRIHVHGRKI